MATKPKATKSGIAHRCPDGARTGLLREGPVDTMEGVTLTCPNCGFTQSAVEMWADIQRAMPIVIAALSPVAR